MSLTPLQAAEKFCPLVQGPCRAGECHFWMWDKVRNEHVIPWPEDIKRPEYEPNPLHQLTKTHQELVEKFFVDSMSALEEGLRGREIEHGEVVGFKLLDKQLNQIKVICESRNTGDCCMRRAAEVKA